MPYLSVIGEEMKMKLCIVSERGKVSGLGELISRLAAHIGNENEIREGL